MEPQGPVPSKQAARSYFRAQRGSLGAAEREQAASRITESVLGRLAEVLPEDRMAPEGAAAQRESPMIAAYLSVPPEPSTRELLGALSARGYTVVVPVCEPEYQLSWAEWTPGVELARSPRAPVLEPVGPRRRLPELPGLRFVLAPAQALDTAGNRLGQGGGYYDRFLADLASLRPDVPVAGIVYSQELVPPGSFAVGELDVALPSAFTPAGYHELGTPPDPV